MSLMDKLFRPFVTATPTPREKEDRFRTETRQTLDQLDQRVTALETMILLEEREWNTNSSNGRGRASSFLA